MVKLTGSTSYIQSAHLKHPNAFAMIYASRIIPLLWNHFRQVVYPYSIPPSLLPCYLNPEGSSLSSASSTSACRRRRLKSVIRLDLIIALWLISICISCKLAQEYLQLPAQAAFCAMQWVVLSECAVLVFGKSSTWSAWPASWLV